MILLAPWALWLLMLGGGVVALYLLKIKRREQVVPSLEFWLALAGRTQSRSLWDKLKRLLSLLLWLAIVACLVLALGNPIFSFGGIKPRAIAVVIDNSASMQAVEGEGAETRLVLARQAVGELTTGRPVSDEWLVIEAAGEARVVQSWTFDGGRARRAAEGVAPFAGSGDLEAGIELARQLLAGKNEPTIVVMSDGASGKAEELASGDERVVFWSIGKASDNLGVAKLAVRNDRQRSQYYVLIGVENAGSEAVQTELTLAINGSPISVELVDAPAQGRWEKTIVLDAAVELAQSGGVLTAKIDRPDALAIDNEASAVLERIQPAVIWLVSEPGSSFFFEQALGAMSPLVWAEQSLTISPAQYEQAAASVLNGTAGAAGAGPSISRPDMIVFNGWAPEKLPAEGKFIFVGEWAKDVPAVGSGEVADPSLFVTPKPHALTEHISLQGVRVEKARRVTLTEPATVLAGTAEGEPLIFLIEQPQRQSLCLAFDVMGSDMPFRNAFPLLLRNAVAYMHEDAPGYLPPRTKIGEVLTPVRALPPGVSSVELTIERGEEPETRAASVEGGRFVFAETSSPGVVSMRVEDRVYRSAIDLCDPAESRLAPSGNAELKDPRATLSLSGRLLGAMPWVGLSVLAAVAIAMEWMTYHLRWTE